MANELEMTALSEAEKDCEMQFAGTSPQIIVDGTEENPYYNIMYRDAADGIVYVGFGSYELENVFGWLKEYFGEDQAKIVDPDNFRPTGHWNIRCYSTYDSWTQETDEEFYLECSECKREVWNIDQLAAMGGEYRKLVEQFPYCHCGCKMEG